MEKISSPESMKEELVRRGWFFREEAGDVLRGLFQSSCPDEIGVLSRVESELMNMDLRDIGGKSLPDPSSIRKSSHLHGPKILQLVSIRDLYQSSIEASFKNSQRRRRLLRICLTDGRSEVIAIEYAPIASITEEIVPGTKVCLESKIPIHNGILCLDSKVVTVLGGLVPSLYEEWQMSQKYSGFSRSTLRLSKSGEGVGPPPFEKLQIEVRPRQVPQQHSSHSSYSDPPKSTSKVALPTKSSGSSDDKQVGRNHGQKILEKSQQTSDSNMNKMDDDPARVSVAGRNEDKPSSSESRPKEAIEAVPVQNQAAAQKLLQRMSQPAQGERQSRGPKYRGKGKQEDPAVFTLDEWERRKGGAKPPIRHGFEDVSHDEELARQLQNQLDLEDFHVKTGSESEADRIRMSMFNFGGAEERNDGGREFRGRGRGRGRGRRRFG